MADLVMFIVGLCAAGLAYAYLLTRVCSHAFFQEKLEYNRSFFKKFDIPHNAGA